MDGGRTASPARGSERKPKAKGLLKEQLELVKAKTVDGQVRYSIKPIEDNLDFEKGFFVVVRALQLLKNSNPGTIVVGVAGPSGAGKTAFSERVKGLLPGIALISMDMYNDGSKVIDSNFDDPRLTDYDLLLANLSDLRAGKECELPIYDFVSSKRTGYRHQPVPESRIVLVEGIYALSERLRPLLDLRVSITGGVHFDLVKRVMRDIQRAGQRPEEIIQQISDTVFPMYKAFIEPDLLQAHLKIVNSFNPFSGFMNATYILKSRRVPTLEAVTAALEALQAGATGSASAPAPGPPQHRKDVDIYDIYLLPPDEEPDLCASWLRMRNREGRYSLMFEETVVEGPFIISPRISFEVNVRILGGLMALGYSIGTIMRRTSTVVALGASGDELQVKLDEIQNLGRFVQILGRDREQVAAVGHALGLDGSYVPRSYIEQVQLERLTKDFQTVTDDWKKVFSTTSGEVVLPDSVSGVGIRSPGVAGSRSVSYNGFASPPSPQLSTSAPINVPTSMNSRAGSRAGSTLNLGLLTQQLGGGNNGSNGPAMPSPLPRSTGGAGPSGLMGSATPGRADGGPPANGSQHGGSRFASEGAAGPSGAALAALQERLDRLGGSLEGVGQLQAQLQSAVAEFRGVGAQLEQLAQATGRLAEGVQEALARSGAGASTGRAGEAGYALAAAAAAVSVGVVVGMALSRWQRTG